MIDRRYHRPSSAALELSDAPSIRFSIPPSIPRFPTTEYWASDGSTRVGCVVSLNGRTRDCACVRKRERSSFDFENNARVGEDNRVLITVDSYLDVEIIARFTVPLPV